MIYLDYAGSTPVLPELLEHYNLISQNFWGNPSATHPVGQLAKSELERSRLKVLETLKLSRNDYNIVFTGGITEANFLALNSYVGNDSKIAYSVLEHDSILNNLKQSESVKIEITKDGFIDLKNLEIKLNSDKKIELVCLVGINSEIGTIQPLAKARELVNRINISRLSTGHSAVKIFSDLAQAPCWLDLSKIVTNLDLFSLSSSKIYSPKGVGCLVYKKQIGVNSVSRGGKQEFGIRAGTENVAGISTFAKALEIAQSEVSHEASLVGTLRDYLYEQVCSLIILDIDENVEQERDLDEKLKPQILLNGFYVPKDVKFRVANNLNIFIPDFETEEVLTALSLKEVCVSSGSNCRSGALTNSPLFDVIRQEKCGANIRFSLGKPTTKNEIDEFVNILSKVLKRLS